jgi:hypothetical protein
LTSADIHRAADEGVIEHDAADRLIQWGFAQKFEASDSAAGLTPPTEQRKGLNLVTVAYYSGAMLMITACAWFLGDKWNALGSRGVFIVTLLYGLIAARVGWWLRTKGYMVGGGLLITVAVCLVPLLTYTIEDMLHLWPGNGPADYKDYYPWINGSWIVMELATILVAGLALRWVRFSFLTAPMAFSFWFLSMDIAALILREPSLNFEARKWVSVIVGLVTILVGYGLDRTIKRSKSDWTEDYAFWCYLFGLMAFWGGLTSMDSGSELKRVVYLLLNVGLIGIAVRLRRSTFLVFGAIGVHIYLGHLAYEVFKDSFFFPFVLALLGLSLILVTVFAQRKMRTITQP